MYCHVRGCRYAWNHVTRHHTCGKCGLKGHGRMECDDAHAKRQLEMHHGHVLPQEMYCRESMCDSPQTHSSDAHVCTKCDQVGHQCLVRAKCPHCRRYGTFMNRVYTDQECTCCFEMHARKVVFDECKHAMICEACADLLVENSYSL